MFCGNCELCPQQPYFNVIPSLWQVSATIASKFCITKHSNTAILILLVNPGLDHLYKLAVLINLLVALQSIMAVDPVCDSGSSGSIGNGNLNRAVQEFLGIKYIIDFLIFQKTVGVDTSSCYIEVLSNEMEFFPVCGSQSLSHSTQQAL